MLRNGLTPLTSYELYCFTNSTAGHVLSSNASIAAAAYAVTTACCFDVSVSPSLSSLQAGQSAVTLVVTAPRGGIDLAFSSSVITNVAAECPSLATSSSSSSRGSDDDDQPSEGADDDRVPSLRSLARGEEGQEGESRRQRWLSTEQPRLLVFRPSSLSFPVSSSSSSLNVTVFAPDPGCFQWTYNLTGGANASLYWPSLSTTGSSAYLAVTSNASSASSYSLPVMTSAEFTGGTGALLLVSFSSDTDQYPMASSSSAATRSFACSSLLSFGGASLCSCYWTGSTSLVVVLDSQASVASGDTITLLPGRLRARCTASTVSECSGWEATATQTVTLGSGYVSPSVVFSSYPTTVSTCGGSSSSSSRLVVDASGSTGSAGRAMTSYAWALSSSSAPDTSLLQELLANTTASARLVLSPVGLYLSAGHDYSFALTVTNWHGYSSTGYTATITATDQPVPTVFIAGRSHHHHWPAGWLGMAISRQAGRCLGGNSSSSSSSLPD